jgi:hypothetical protein
MCQLPGIRDICINKTSQIMNTIKLESSYGWTSEAAADKQSTVYNRIIAFADSQNKNRTAWFLVSLVAQGVLFLPVPAALIYYFNAPILVLAVTMALFFANVIAGMGGSSIRTLIFLFAASILVNLAMIAALFI